MVSIKFQITSSFLLNSLCGSLMKELKYAIIRRRKRINCWSVAKSPRKANQRSSPNSSSWAITKGGFWLNQSSIPSFSSSSSKSSLSDELPLGSGISWPKTKLFHFLMINFLLIYGMGGILLPTFIFSLPLLFPLLFSQFFTPGFHIFPSFVAFFLPF